MTLRDLAAPYRSVSLIGMCKNAGKTTTMNQLIKAFHQDHVAFAVTSVGRDGESTDLVTNTVKPGIYVYKGTIVATAADLLKYCDVTKEILETTGIYTPLGQIVTIRALSDGFVQVAGPSMTTQLARISGTFSDYAIDKILIDGALGRKSLCSKKVSESTILCTGASYHKDMNVVVRDTVFIEKLLQLPEADISGVHVAEENTDRKYFPVNENGEICLSQQKETLEQLFRRGRKDAPTMVYVHGGMTDAMVRTLLLSNTDLKNKTLVLRDGSRILLSYEMYEKLLIRGLRFMVLDAIDLLAITINPFSAYGFHFDKDEFMERMREAATVPVINVREEILREKRCEA